MEVTKVTHTVRLPNSFVVRLSDVIEIAERIGAPLDKAYITAIPNGYTLEWDTLEGGGEVG